MGINDDSIRVALAQITAMIEATVLLDLASRELLRGRTG